MYDKILHQLISCDSCIYDKSMINLIPPSDILPSRHHLCTIARHATRKARPRAKRPQSWALPGWALRPWRTSPPSMARRVEQHGVSMNLDELS